jgi:hypothetical protein
MTSTEENVQETHAPEETETAAVAAGESELTEVDPAPMNEEEAVAMKVVDNSDENENEADEQPEAKMDPHAALMQMPVTDQNSALNCLIGFVGVAQRRGVFALDEAAKAFHCIQMFHPGNQKS